ncbi:hypothetical protein SAMN04487957_11093 [Halomonas shengliensis]|uniref:Uncharacterized protein n=1 Tax=Halomonas shengliensis TaxID=419597 RepID=A0A1H0LTE8_9GAMM|nr:hypothetical protein [Halomonas shengliensis]SDO71256.1 hypothetical protein SAMN04487957_11093 [Halomonas shengliensis]
MKTSVSDLREHLFLQLERLKDDANGEELTDEALQREVTRAKAVSQVASAIIGTAKIEVEYAKATGQALPSDFLPQGDTKRIKGD